MGSNFCMGSQKCFNNSLIPNSMQAYADDHWNDVVLNTASILGALLAADFAW